MFTFPILLTASLVGAPASKDPAPKPGAGLEGKWELVSGEERGERHKPDEPITVTVKAAEMIFRRGTDDQVRYTYAVDNSKSPAHLNISVEPPKGVCHAIFRFEGEELVLCSGSKFDADQEEDRPSEFATAAKAEEMPKKGKLLLRFKRIKE